MCEKSIIAAFTVGWITGPFVWHLCNKAMDAINGEETIKRKKDANTTRNNCKK